jgi:hypothetical protein
MAALYGCDSYPYVATVGPVGGGVGFQTYYDPTDTTSYTVVRVPSGGTLSSAASGAAGTAIKPKLIWLDSSISMSTAISLKEYTILASSRGQNGAVGPLITYTGSGDFIFVVGSHVILSGLRIQGPNAAGGMRGIMVGHNSNNPLYSIYYTKIENCWVRDFGRGCLWIYDNIKVALDDANWSKMTLVTHSDFAGSRMCGNGYCLAAYGPMSAFKTVASKFDIGRHLTMLERTTSTPVHWHSYEAQYCWFGQAWQGDCSGTGSASYDNQPGVDGHDNGTYQMRIHNCTFEINDFNASSSEKACVGIRGTPGSQIKTGGYVDCHDNWIKRVTAGGNNTVARSGLYPSATNGASNATLVTPPGYGAPVYCELRSEHALSLKGGQGTACNDTNMPSHRFYAHTNWYGATAPPGGTTPIIQTTPATAISAGGATLNGNVISLGAEPSTDTSFQWGTTTAYGSVTPTVNRGLGSFSAVITGLAPSTTYHFRARSVGMSTIYGEDVTFVTLGSATPPSVTTSAATDVDVTTAILNCNLSNLGTASTVLVHFEYGLTTAYGTITTPSITATATGVLGWAISGLTPNTTYHFRAVAAGNGTTNGADANFTTLPYTPTTPTCTAAAATAVTSSGATLNASVTGLGSAIVVTRGFRWDTDSGSPYTNEWHEDGEWTANGTFSHVVEGLLPETKYYFTSYMILR